MTGAHATEKWHFKECSRRNLDIAIIIAVSAHFVGFVVSPGYEPKPFALMEEAVFVLDIVEDVEVPLPPVEIPRPSIPMAVEFTDVMVSAEEDLDITIEDTEINLQDLRPARLRWVDPGTTDAEFLSFSQPPLEKKLYRPSYPDLARRAGIEGTVVAKVYIDEKGHVFRVVILESPAEIFNQTVIDALLRSEFIPAMQREIPVKSRIIVPFEFTLRSPGD